MKTRWPLPRFAIAGTSLCASAIKLPRGMSTTSTDTVTDAVVRSIVDNRGEIDVAALPMRLGAAAANLAPATAARVGRLIGAEALALEFERRQTDKR